MKRLAVIDAVVDLSAYEFGWKTVLFNCHCHSFDEVIRQLIKAVGCSESEASEIASRVHYEGLAVVCQGEKGYCGHVADVLSAIGLRVTLSQ